MKKVNANLRKAAVLIRSLDADTAVKLLAQLSSEEAARVRAEMQTLGEIEPEEQADLVAEFRRIHPLASESPQHGVELTLSKQSRTSEVAALHTKRFSFLEEVPVDVLVPVLAREHAQTIAVVLSYLPPSRAAEVLALLPEKIQIEAIERIAVLGETDAEAVTVLERELAAWLEKRVDSQKHSRRSNVVSAILAATDAKTRTHILKNLARQSSPVLKQLTPSAPRSAPQKLRRPKLTSHAASQASVRSLEHELRHEVDRPSPKRNDSAPKIHFDDLLHLDDCELTAVLQKADPNVLALALAGSREEFLNRICRQMSRHSAKKLRRELQRLTPTRLSDVEAAQRAIAEIYAAHLSARHNRLDA